MLLAMGQAGGWGMLESISYGTKLIAALAGGWVPERRAVKVAAS